MLLAAAALLAELTSLVLVGSYVGWLGTFGLLALAVVAGVAVLSGRGAATIRDVVVALQERRSPAKALVDGALMVVAGVLLITPGFASDVVGIALLLPPVRAGIRARMRAWLKARVARGHHPGFVGHDDSGVDGIEVIDASGTERPEAGSRRPPGGPSLPS